MDLNLYTLKKVQFYSGKTNVKIDIFDENFESVKFYDVRGLLICSDKLNKGINTILLKGEIYIVKVHLRNKIKTKKLL